MMTASPLMPRRWGHPAFATIGLTPLYHLYYLNMVRAGVVSHPKHWDHGGYNEIQNPIRKNILIDYETLGRLSGFTNFDGFQVAHRRWVESAISNNKIERE